MFTAPFYQTARWQQVAINLFYGWGFNFYRLENQLRSDDLLIREKVSYLLTHAHAAIAAAESEFRQQQLPPPTREQPFADPQAIRQAKGLAALGHSVATIESAIRAAPVPENDRMWQRHRREANLLAQLLEIDTALVAIANAFATQCDTEGSPWILHASAEIQATVQELNNLLHQRNLVLSSC